MRSSHSEGVKRILYVCLREALDNNDFQKRRSDRLGNQEKTGRLYSHLPIRTKLILTFCLTALLMFIINILLYNEINRSMRELDAIYATNVSLNELSECLEETQEEVYEYLNTKSSDSLENYYRSEQNLKDMLSMLNYKNIDSSMKMLEKNIRNMSESWLVMTEETLQAKRGRNVEKYKNSFNAATEYYHYIQAAIYSLNNLQFGTNSSNYQIMMNSLNYMEIVSSVIVIVVAVINLLILVILVQSITQPLRQLAAAANEVAAGNFEITIPLPDSMDEVGIVTNAFTKMITSIREYVVKIREGMEKEQKMMERELLMETHLKDAQLKYLQAQINPHFLFNSLNAGAQLAMMEDAEQTSIFIEKMADFFRYNVRKIEEATTLAEEIEAVDNYVYILNVRFAGDIHFEKEIAPAIDEVKLPSMILQPIVENAVNHGIRNAEWEGHIWLTVEEGIDALTISVRDNGLGMTGERIREILECRAEGNRLESDSTGIGLDNVIHRLELYYNRKGLVDIRSDGPGCGTEVRITIPFDQDSGQKTG